MGFPKIPWFIRFIRLSYLQYSNETLRFDFQFETALSLCECRRYVPRICQITRVDELEWCTRLLRIRRRNAPSLASEPASRIRSHRKRKGHAAMLMNGVKCTIIFSSLSSYYIIQAYESYLLSLSLLIANSVDCWVWIPGGAVTCQSKDRQGTGTQPEIQRWNPLLCCNSGLHIIL